MVSSTFFRCCSFVESTPQLAVGDAPLPAGRLAVGDADAAALPTPRFAALGRFSGQLVVAPKAGMGTDASRDDIDHINESHVV